MAKLPDKTSLTDPAVTQAGFRAALDQLNDYLAGLLDASGKVDDARARLNAEKAGTAATTVAAAIEALGLPDSIAPNTFLRAKADGSGYAALSVQQVADSLRRHVLRGIPFYHQGNTPPPGAIVYNGALLPREDYPELWEWAQTYTTVVPDGQWNVLHSGLFSSGDGATTFRVPDLRAEIIRGLDSGRGIDVGRLVGSRQADALQGHHHYVRGGGTQIFGLTTDTPVMGATARLSDYTTGQALGVATDGNFGGARVAAETRMRNVAYLPCAYY